MQTIQKGMPRTWMAVNI